MQDKASIILFPEGNQAMKKHLREMKKGTAHMIFQAAQATDFQEVIYIIPVGLEYENYLKAGRKVALRFGKTISVASYYEQFQKNEKAAIESLTNELANMISPYIIDVKNKKVYEQTMNIYTVCKPFLFEKEDNHKEILAKNKAFIEFTVLNDEFEKEAGTDDNFDPYDGLFSPSCILLLDQFGECITRYKNSEWQESHDLPSKDEYEALMAKSQQLRNDASIEAGWDNFSTAQSMRCEARNIELLIQMSKNIARLDNT